MRSTTATTVKSRETWPAASWTVSTSAYEPGLSYDRVTRSPILVVPSAKLHSQRVIGPLALHDSPPSRVIGSPIAASLRGRATAWIAGEYCRIYASRTNG